MAQRTRVQRYIRLNGKYLREAEVLLQKGDYAQASEKLWGAAAEITKAVAEKRGRKTRTHSDLWEIVEELHAESPELTLLEDFYAASHLHSNFYEDELRPSAVDVGAEAVRRFCKNVEPFL